MSDSYQKLDPREHVLLRPGMYIGSVRPDEAEAWVLEGGRIRREAVSYTPGFLTVFDEVLANAVDHCWRSAGCDRPVRNIRVSLPDADDGEIEVWNDGPGIPVETHAETGALVPELIFGTMLTSSNYDDSRERTVGGQNGVGAKSTNIFSRRFTVEACDGARRFCKTWTDNMSASEPAVVSPARRAPFTRVAFRPDYARFGMQGLDAAARRLLRKRVADACAVTPAAVTVALDGDRLPYKSFERYVDMYIGPKSETPRHYERLGDDWEVCVCESPDGAFRHVSFVNGICTPKGGKHVEHVAAALCKRVAEAMAARRGAADAPVKPATVRAAMWLFLRCTVPNPSFDSQTKDCLTTPATAFRSKCEIPQAFVDRVARGAVGERAAAMGRAALAVSARKTDGKMRSSVAGVPKLEDALWAGTARSAQCTLILTEGDSAKTMAMSGLAVVGRDRYGVFPLKGKLLNTRDAAASKVTANEEIANIKKIMGLEAGKDYSAPDARRGLRYGAVLVLADQDVDGYHIRGLVFNLFHTLWPSLFALPGFLRSMLTPVARVFGGRAEPPRSFYNLPDLEAHLLQHAAGHAPRVKYYKGLGTSTADDARQYFRDMKLVRYTLEPRPTGRVALRVSIDEGTGAVTCAIEVRTQSADDAMDMAFNKARAADRKEWLRDAAAAESLDYTQPQVPVVDFVNRELRLFSLDDVARSIPSAVDGLKVSQRKIVYACKLRPRSAGEMRVAQLAGFVSEKAAYHHGEASLQAAIVGLAQAFVGSNNLPLLAANGQFGSRLANGRDAASARYIYTEMLPAAHALFPAADEPVLARRNDDDRNPVEPEHYAPVLPLALLNGANGIGTGFSTSVPAHDPREVLEVYKRALAASPAAATAQLEAGMRALLPRARGFRGRVARVGDRTLSFGVFQRTAAAEIVITELPIGTWTDDYKAWLEEKGAELPIRRFESHSTDVDVRFVVTAEPAVLDAWLAETDPATGAPALATKLRLVSDKGLSTRNMYLFDARGRIRLYAEPAAIAQEHFAERLRVYDMRRRHELSHLRARLAVVAAKAEFVADVVARRLVLDGAPDGLLERHAAARGWPPLDTARATAAPFDYLARMPITSVTAARHEALQRELAAAHDAIAALEAKGPRDLYAEDLALLEPLLPV